MFLAYTTIGQAIQKAVPQIAWFDLDKGQLDNPEQFNSIGVPGILIGHSEIDWSSLGSGNSLGEGTVTVKLVLRLPSQTHLTDPLLLKNLEQPKLGDPINRAVLSVPGVIARIKSLDYPSGTYYVLEQMYTPLFSSGPTYVNKKVNVHVNPFLNKPTARA